MASKHFSYMGGPPWYIAMISYGMRPKTLFSSISMTDNIATDKNAKNRPQCHFNRDHSQIKQEPFLSPWGRIKHRISHQSWSRISKSNNRKSHTTVAKEGLARVSWFLTWNLKYQYFLYVILILVCVYTLHLF